MAVSGKCYLSLHEMNSSANRGACTQICRRGYTVTDRETGDELAVENKYIMSPKDLKTIHFLNKMIDAGVRVFKIEGRARGPEYVKIAVQAYSEAIEAICRGEFTEDRIARWDEELSKIFNRGFTERLLSRPAPRRMVGQIRLVGHPRKALSAKGVRYFPKLGVGEFLMEGGELHVGDEVVITGTDTGAIIMTVEELRADYDPVPVVKKGRSFSIKVPRKIRPSDRLYIREETALTKTEHPSD